MPDSAKPVEPPPEALSKPAVSKAEAATGPPVNRIEPPLVRTSVSPNPESDVEPTEDDDVESVT